MKSIYTLIFCFMMGIFSLTVPVLQAAETRVPVCTVCGKACTGKYYTKDGKIFCSDACIGKVYSCSSCGTALGTSANPRFTTMKDIHEKPLLFCSECMKKPGCYFCGSRKSTTPLPDGRIICVTCREHAVFTTEQAEPLLRSARKMLFEKFGFPNDREIPMKVVSADEFRKHLSSSNANSNAMALHLTQFSGETQLSEDGKILTIRMTELDSGMVVLEGSPAELAFDSIVHELTHEFLRRRFYHFEDSKIEEGFCESIAAACSIFNGCPSLAQRRAGNEDPIYGDGFRMMYTMLQEKGWDETMKFLEANSQSLKTYVRMHLEEVVDAETREHLKKNNLHPKIRFVK